MVRSRFRPNLVFAGHKTGLAILQKISGDWRVVGNVAGVTAEIRSVAEAAPGYPYRITAGDFSQVRKLTLVR